MNQCCTRTGGVLTISPCSHRVHDRSRTGSSRVLRTWATGVKYTRALTIRVHMSSYAMNAIRLPIRRVRVCDGGGQQYFSFIFLSLSFAYVIPPRLRYTVYYTVNNADAAYINIGVHCSPRVTPSRNGFETRARALFHGVVSLSR